MHLEPRRRFSNHGNCIELPVYCTCSYLALLMFLARQHASRAPSSWVKWTWWSILNCLYIDYVNMVVNTELSVDYATMNSLYSQFKAVRCTCNCYTAPCLLRFKTWSLINCDGESSFLSECVTFCIWSYTWMVCWK